MQITPDQLRYLREQRDLTRDELAKELDCSAGAIVQWEGGKRAIPSWVADKMWRQLPLDFNVEELAQLLELARTEGLTLIELLTDAAKSILAQRRAPKASLIAKGDKDLLASPACVENAASKSPIPSSASEKTSTANIVRLPPPPLLSTITHDSLKVAESVTPYVIEKKKRRANTDD